MNLLGYQQITSLSAAVSLSAPSGTRLAIVQAEAQTVRWRDDGTDPTASVGMRLHADDTMQYVANDNDFAKIKFIEEVAGAILNVSYYSW